MKTTTTNNSETETLLEVVASKEELAEAKERALMRIQPSVSADGFRKGKVPLKQVEKHIDPKTVNTEALDEAVNSLLIQAIQKENIRVLDQPEVEVTKFVAGEELEFKAKLSVLAPIKLGDYKKLKKKLEKVTVTDEDIEKVLDNLKLRIAEKKEVDRASKDDDEVWIDFDGVDADGKEIAGAKGTDYPLRLGSNTFIPGFEENLVGVKKGDEKTFDLTFPKDYGHQPLANKKVTFTVKVRIVKEVVLPESNDAFAAKVGPFESIEALKTDVREQLVQQKMDETSAKLQDEIVEELLEKSEIIPPQSFVDEQKKMITSDFKQNLTYRGITMAEYLKQSGMTEEEYDAKELTPQAEKRVKVGLLISEVAEREDISVTDEEVIRHTQLLSGQMQQSQPADLQSEQAQRDIRNRLITQKTLEKLVEYATN